MDEEDTNEHRVKYAVKTWNEHLISYWSYFTKEGATLISTWLAGIAVTEFLVALSGSRPPWIAVIVPVAGVGILAAGFRAFQRYRSYVSPALLDESQKSKDIAWNQRFGWQWNLAHELLTQRLRASDAALDRLRRGSQFVEPIKLPANEYWGWLIGRTGRLTRLADAVKVQVVTDLMGSIGKITDEEGIADMMVEIESLTSQYLLTVKFEEECHAMVPPEGFSSVHEVSYAWTDTIRDFMNEFLGVCQSLADMNRRALRKGQIEPPSFTLKMAAPANIDEFIRRLERIDPSIFN